VAKYDPVGTAPTGSSGVQIIINPTGAAQAASDTLQRISEQIQRKNELEAAMKADAQARTSASFAQAFQNTGAAFARTAEANRQRKFEAAEAEKQRAHEAAQRQADRDAWRDRIDQEAKLQRERDQYLEEVRRKAQARNEKVGALLNFGNSMAHPYDQSMARAHGAMLGARISAVGRLREILAMMGIFNQYDATNPMNHWARKALEYATGAGRSPTTQPAGGMPTTQPAGGIPTTQPAGGMPTTQPAGGMSFMGGGGLDMGAAFRGEVAMPAANYAFGGGAFGGGVSGGVTPATRQGFMDWQKRIDEVTQRINFEERVPVQDLVTTIDLNKGWNGVLDAVGAKDPVLADALKYYGDTFAVDNPPTSPKDLPRVLPPQVADGVHAYAARLAAALDSARASGKLSPEAHEAAGGVAMRLYKAMAGYAQSAKGQTSVEYLVKTADPAGQAMQLAMAGRFPEAMQVLSAYENDLMQQADDLIRMWPERAAYEQDHADLMRQLMIAAADDDWVATDAYVNLMRERWANAASRFNQGYQGLSPQPKTPGAPPINLSPDAVAGAFNPAASVNPLPVDQAMMDWAAAEGDLSKYDLKFPTPKPKKTAGRPTSRTRR